MALLGLDIDINYRRPLLPANYEMALITLQNNYLGNPQTTSILSSIKRDIDIINYIFEKRIDFIGIEDGRMILYDGVEIIIPESLTRRVLFEKR